MKASVSPEKQALIDEAAALGIEVGSKQIDRWRTEKLLPTPTAEGRGRGKGIARTAPPGTVAQLVALAKFLKEERSFDLAAFRLWIDGYDIPIERVRRALREIVPRTADPQKVAEYSTKIADGLHRKKGVSKQVRALSRDGGFYTLFDTMATAAFGGQVSIEQQKQAAREFEAATGLDKARSDTLPGIGPWLSGETTPDFMEAMSLSSEWLTCLDSVTDEQLLQAKTDLLNYEKMIAWAGFAQNLYGDNRFGLGVFTDSFLGQPVTLRGPLLFTGLVLIRSKKPELSEKLRIMADNAEAALTQLSSAVETELNSIRNPG